VADYNGFKEAGLGKLNSLVSSIVTLKPERGEVVDVDCRS
jgi:hypothetical protein